MINQDANRLPEVVDCLWDPDACVRMRAADALEKLSRDSASRLQPFKNPLLDLAAESKQKEVRWHLALIVPRLCLTNSECAQAAELLESYLNDRSSIVKTCAMQGLADLAQKYIALRPGVTDLIHMLAKTGTPAMRARGRILLKGWPA